VKLSIRQPARLAWIALLIAAGAMLLSASGAQAASKRGAVLVKDISPGNPKHGRAGSSNPSGLTDVAGTLFFAAEDRRHGTELWRSDGTRRGTRMVKDINPGPRPCATSKGACRGQGASSYPSLLTAVGRTLYFTADDGIHGPELWRSNGTSRGTRMVKDITPGSRGNYNSSLTNVAGILYFAANGGLWRSDGTASGTVLVKGFGSDPNLTNAAGTLFLAANDGAHAGLWRSDGTAAGTTLVKEFSEVGYLTEIGGTAIGGILYFTANDGAQGGLWRTDGTEAGTILVKEGSANDLTAVGGTLYFITPGLDSWLWRSDGTEAGTVPITPVGPTPEADALYPSLTAVGDTLYFVRNGPPAGYLGGTLMRTDGTPSGTRELGSGMIPRHLTAVGNTLYFEGYDTKHGNELWQSDGTQTGTRLVRDIRRGERSSRPGEHTTGGLTAVGRTLFFSARDGRHGTELWRAGPKPCKTAKGKCKKG
jgi:ELWxxDGT repeat protein